MPIDARGTERFVAVLATDASLFGRKDYYGRVLQGFSDGLLELRLRMRMIGCRHEYQQEHFLATLGTQYAGLVFMGNLYRFEDFIRGAAARFAGPKVLLDHFIAGLPAHSVQEDAEAGMRALVGHLLGLGHRTVAYLDMYRPADNPWKRAGINAALREAGLAELGPGMVAACRDSYGDVLTALDWFLELAPRPTALVCFDDDRALMLMQAAAERGLRVPADLSIAGYGDTAVSRGQSRILTSVDIDPPGMGRKAAELVAGPAAAEPVAVLMAPKLALRGSTAPPPGE